MTPTIATYDLYVSLDEPEFQAGDLRVQASTPLELMALPQASLCPRSPAPL